MYRNAEQSFRANLIAVGFKAPKKQNTFPASIANGLLDTAQAVLAGPMRSSAELALADGRALAAKGDRYDYAAGRALKSIAYSVGVLSDTYRNAAIAFEDWMGWNN